MEQMIYEFMEKMYSDLMNEISSVKKELESLKQDVESVKQDVTSVNQEVSSVKQDVKTIGNQVIRLENDLKPKIEAGLDGYRLVIERLNTLENKVDNINTKVEKQEVEIKVIKGGR